MAESQGKNELRDRKKNICCPHQDLGKPTFSPAGKKPDRHPDLCHRRCRGDPR
ncbi:MAG: hypothetical protein ACK55I_01225 [bacterium]